MQHGDSLYGPRRSGLYNCGCSSFASHSCAVRTASGVILVGMPGGGLLGDTDATERPGGTLTLMSMGSTVMHGSTVIDWRLAPESAGSP